jgi:hypothetical protein
MAEPRTPEEVRAQLRENAGWDGDARPDGEQVGSDEIRRCAALMGAALKWVGNSTAVKLARHSVLIYTFGEASTKRLCVAEAKAIIEWLEAEPGAFVPARVPAEECRRMFSACLEERGQRRLL